MRFKLIVFQLRDLEFHMITNSSSQQVRMVFSESSELMTKTHKPRIRNTINQFNHLKKFLSRNKSKTNTLLILSTSRIKLKSRDKRKKPQ